MWGTPTVRSTPAVVPGRLFATLSLLLGCISGGGEPPSRVGAWYATDMHIHTSHGSNDTDGESPVAAHVAVAEARGLDLLIFTDHSNSAGSMDCATGDVEDCPNQGPEFPAWSVALDSAETDVQLAVGVEFSPVASLDTTTEPTGHIGCIPRADGLLPQSNRAMQDRPVGTVAGGSGIEWCAEQGGWSVLNHPYALAPWIAYDWSDLHYDGMEIFNGGARFDSGDAHAVTAWMCDVAQGRDIVAVGGSDTHRAATETPPPGPLDQALGFPTTWVWSATPEGVLDALEAGHTVVSDPTTTLDIVAWTPQIAVGPGGSIQGPVTVRVTASVAHAGLRVEVLGLRDGDCVVDTRTDNGAVPLVEAEVLYSLALDPDAVVEHTMTMDAPVHIIARVWPATDPVAAVDGVAVAAPISVLPRDG